MLVFLNPIRCQLRTIATHYFFITIQGDSIMLRKLLCFSSIALLAGLPLLSALTTSVRAESQGPIVAPLNEPIVKITNISGLERRPNGGHKAKITYKVTLQPGFGVQLNKINGAIEFKLLGGSTQRKTFSIDTSKLEDTIEVTAPGALLSVDQQPEKITASISAISRQFVTGKVSAVFFPNGTFRQQTSQSGLPITIVKISDFKRLADNGHQVRVHYQASSFPSGFAPGKLEVGAQFQLNESPFQNGKVSKTTNISEVSSELVTAPGNPKQNNAEVLEIRTGVRIDGEIFKSGNDSRTEQCIRTSDCIN
jgi:hypothetical protein